MVGAVTKALGFHLLNHADHATLPFGLTLGQESQLADFGGCEEHGCGVGAGCNAGSTTDASSGVHSQVCVFLSNRDCIGILRGAGVDRDKSPRLNDAVQGRAINDQVPQHGKCLGAERFDPDHVPIAEATHVQLAGGGFGFRSVGLAVDHQAAHAADSLAAIVVEGDRLAPIFL